MIKTLLTLAILLTAAPVLAQVPNDPFPDPIAATDGVIVVGVRDFAVLPATEGQPARPMRLVEDPGSERLFVNDMWGSIYTVSDDGEEVERYLDIDDPRWGIPVESSGRERGVQSFVLHPAVCQPGNGWLREAVCLARHARQGARAGLRVGRGRGLARHGSRGVHRPGCGRRHV